MYLYRTSWTRNRPVPKSFSNLRVLRMFFISRFILLIYFSSFSFVLWASIRFNIILFGFFLSHRRDFWLFRLWALIRLALTTILSLQFHLVVSWVEDLFLVLLFLLLENRTHDLPFPRVPAAFSSCLSS